MSAIISKILRSTVGLLWGKIRDAAAEKLKDGDVADGKLREIIVRDLSDIQVKLDGLSRKDLLSCFSFLKQGIDILTLALAGSFDMQSSLGGNHLASSDVATSRTTDERFGVMSDALEFSHAMERFKLASGHRFQSAKECFKAAREEATRAFCNEALRIQDRIMAAKVFITAAMLQNLESPDTAMTLCQSFLKELHALRAVRQIFTVYLNGGLKSMVNKAERLENVKSVMLINYVVFQFISKFSSKWSDRFIWPNIELSDRSLNPICNWRDIFDKNSRDAVLRQAPNKVPLSEDIYSRVSAVNSRGDVLARAVRGISVTFCGGETKNVALPQPKLGYLIDSMTCAVAVDDEDNVYVVRWLKTRLETDDVKIQYLLIVLDENFLLKYECPLDFLHFSNLSFHWVKIAVNSDKSIMVCPCEGNDVFVSDEFGRLKFSFEREVHAYPSMSILDKNEILIKDGSRDVTLYTKRGKSKLKLKLPKEYTAQGAAYHYVISKIIVLSWNARQWCHSLLRYSDTGDLETSCCLCEGYIMGNWPSITSHPAGPVAVVGRKSIFYI